MKEDKNCKARMTWRGRCLCCAGRRWLCDERQDVVPGFIGSLVGENTILLETRFQGLLRDLRDAAEAECDVLLCRTVRLLQIREREGPTLRHSGLSVAAALLSRGALHSAVLDHVTDALRLCAGRVTCEKARGLKSEQTAVVCVRTGQDGRSRWPGGLRTVCENKSQHICVVRKETRRER